MATKLRRMRHFPEIVDAERATVLDRWVAEPNAIFDSAILNKAAKAVCGATHIEIHQWINEATLTLHDREERGTADERQFPQKFDGKIEATRPDRTDAFVCTLEIPGPGLGVWSCKRLKVHGFQSADWGQKTMARLKGRDLSGPCP